MIRIKQIHLATDGPIAPEAARELAATFGAGIHDTMRERRRGSARVEINEIRLTLPASVCRDRKALAGHARMVAEHILERTLF